MPSMDGKVVRTFSRRNRFCAASEAFEKMLVDEKSKDPSAKVAVQSHRWSQIKYTINRVQKEKIEKEKKVSSPERKKRKFFSNPSPGAEKNKCDDKPKKEPKFFRRKRPEDSPAIVDEPPKSTPPPPTAPVVTSSQEDEISFLSQESTQSSPSVIFSSQEASSKPRHIFRSPRKERARYKPKLWNMQADDQQDSGEGAAKSSSVAVKSEKAKLYTVVRNVKEAFECHEIGTQHDFSADVEYLIGGLSPSRSIKLRCLSVIKLVEKCSEGEFRMHLRAQEHILKEIFNSLADADRNETMALCVAALFSMLSRDRLQIEFEEGVLAVLVRLVQLEMSSDADTKIMEQIEALCPCPEGGSLTAQDLALDGLLSLTSRRATEKLKASMCELKAIDCLVDRVSTCIIAIQKTPSSSAAPSTVPLLDRCIRSLETLTSMHTDNQKYVIQLQQRTILDSLNKFIHCCRSRLIANNMDSTIMSALLQALSLLIVLTSESEDCCTYLGRRDQFIECLLDFGLKHCDRVAENKKTDFVVFSLAILVNLIEKSIFCCKELFEFEFENETSLEALGKFYLKHQDLAKESECHLDLPLQSDSQTSSQAEEFNESISKALHHAGRNMEHSMMAAYAALLMGAMLVKHKDALVELSHIVPNGDCGPMVELLKNFMETLKLANAITDVGCKSMQNVISLFESV